MNKRKNCYSCGRFGYIVRNCKNWKLVGQGRRIEYEDNLNNLKEKENLVVLK